MSWKEKLISGDDINKVLKIRKEPFARQKIDKALIISFEQDGWIVDKELKTKFWMKKEKPIGEQFEDEVWCLVARMGFNTLNRDRFLSIPYSQKSTSLSQQIDVLAIDDETILIIECKALQNKGKPNFKKELEGIKGYFPGIRREIERKFPKNPKRKVKFIFATKNCVISDKDANRMKDFQIYHIDENDISYYSKLVDHLGSAARFQFLGALFKGQRISAMENKIPAIKGKMGGLTYYSFVIRPYDLLKISFVSHRVDAHSDREPAYQRLINKGRVKDIRKFINEGGFFPNSLIVSLETRKNRKLEFKPAPKEFQGDSGLTKIGILHLPQEYSSAYIVDGQHRLYGYSDSKYVENNSVPVVAFENIDREKQVELFIEINENQKKVSKQLRNTLNSELLWDDKKEKNRRKAIRLRVAIELGERPDSPLFERIRIGEKITKDNCRITIETIEIALAATRFLSTFDDDNKTLTYGYFDKNDNEQTLITIYEFLEKVFNYLKNSLSEEWDIGEEREILTSNNGIYAIIKVLDDILIHRTNTDNLTHPFLNSINIFEKVERYLIPIISFFETLSEQERNEIKKFYGAGGRTNAWRKLQQVINATDILFNPEGLEEWLEDESKNLQLAAMELVLEIETFLKKDIREKLESKYEKNYFVQGVPQAVYTAAYTLAKDKDFKENVIDKHDPWDCLNLIHYREIIIKKENWSDLFSRDYSFFIGKGKNGDKKEQTSWMVKLNDIRNTVYHNNPISEEELDTLKTIYEELGKKK